MDIFQKIQINTGGMCAKLFKRINYKRVYHVNLAAGVKWWIPIGIFLQPEMRKQKGSTDHVVYILDVTINQAEPWHDDQLVGIWHINKPTAK